MTHRSYKVNTPIMQNLVVIHTHISTLCEDLFASVSRLSPNSFTMKNWEARKNEIVGAEYAFTFFFLPPN